MIRRAHSGQRQRGQTLAEFALAAPIIFLVLLGLIDAGRLVFINNEISLAARESARWGAVQSRAAEEAAGANTDVTDHARSRLVVTPGPTVTLACDDLGGQGGDCGSGDLLKIKVSSAVSPITPVIGDIIGPLVLESESSMVIH